MKKLFAAVLATAMLAGCSSTANSSKASVAETAETTVEKSEGTMTHAEYAETAADGTVEVTVEAYVQGKQSWWEDNGQGKATVYAQDDEGGYLFYELHITEDDYNKLTDGTLVKVTGYKSAWEGEEEVVDGEVEILSGSKVADTTDVSDVADADLAKYANMKVAFKDAEVVAVTAPDSEGGDIYYDVKAANGETYTFAIESYLTDSSTDVYQTVLGLQAGDKIDAEGFLYNYKGWQLHTTAVTVK